ncbi:PhzF family phenazine biosynthesis protein [Nocardioides jishulii]|uniref:PhzF family phenazine biosynthesis protein n=1 Tax=Nocardioides jishulii TaxID=2575440 RepID=A0A4U2YMU7_9ACTN|nr:PhzF family phenazine biosynthesis protein [Nocardioides jishulii]QCX27782.1 PhzF family phenazine biosynthesis protein [Nocardioides jishulii]TKI62589.1 PhzF family phenazine biosynthesis protein [Nocardioides jishulii]
MHSFSQVDVFSPDPWGGNPVAVVHGADDLDDAQMAAFARWTNLSETTFLLAPRAPGADYRLRIFTIEGELPFAGHPTLGSAHAWLEAGGVPSGDDVMQECGVGLVTVRRRDVLAFAAPPLLRSGEVEADVKERVLTALRVGAREVEDLQWIDNGPGWIGVLMRDADAVLGVRPDVAALEGLAVGLAGLHAPGGECAVEVRALFGTTEDPVTGSLNAGLAQWLVGAGVLPQTYVARQGTVLGRTGRVHVERRDGEYWVGGATRTSVRGTVAFAD